MDDIYQGPLTGWIIMRRNLIANNAHISIGENTHDTLVENCTIRNSNSGIKVGKGTKQILLRNNTFVSVDRTVYGDGFLSALVLPKNKRMPD